MSVTLTPARLPEDVKLIKANTDWQWNKDIFAECVELGCVPLVEDVPLMRRGDAYYIVHHEEVVLYAHSSNSSVEERVAATKAWLHSHHVRLRGILRQ